MRRREFVNISFVAGSGLVLGINYACYASKGLSTTAYTGKGEKHLFNPFLKIADDGQILIYAPVPEIGQGTRTSLPMILAEELDADWQQINILQAPAGDQYGNMAAAGSTSVERFYEPLRKAGAVAREMLKAAAAKKWNVSPSTLTTENSFVYKNRNGERISYAELAGSAASLPVPEDIQLKNAIDFKIIGKAKKNVDLQDMVTGKAVYGIDTVQEGMKYVAIERCPVRGGSLISFNAEKALAVEGVLEVLEIKPYRPIAYAEVLPGVAVIAENTSAALKGKKLLSVDWDFGKTAKEDNQIYKAQYQKLKEEGEKKELRKTEAFSESLKASDEVLEFDYEIPFWAHYCMEPMNFTAYFSTEKCILQGPNQRPQLIQDLVSQIYKIPLENVEVISTLAGGGFGRRLAVDYALEALIVSKESGYPVKVIWTREDDVLHDYFRTISFHHFKIGLKDRKLNAWFHHLMTMPIGDGPIYEVQGAADLPFEIPNIEIVYSQFPTGIQIGSWRSVAHSYNSFVVNNTITEVGEHLKKDPLEFYLELMSTNSETIVKLPFPGYRGEVRCDLDRLRSVIKKAADLAGWEKPRRENTALGIACAFYKTSYAAHVVEVIKIEDKIKINKITAVLDCGKVINPLGIKAQMEGSISDAITVCLKSMITIKNGMPQEINFDRYPVTRIQDMPEMELHVMDSEEDPSGAGEPPFPSAVPAIANAFYRLTGKKIRTLPISI